LPVVDFQATLRLTPVVDGDRAFVEWWATFNCDPSRRDELTGTLQSWFAAVGWNRCAMKWAANRSNSRRNARKPEFTGHRQRFRRICASMPEPRVGCCIRQPLLA
jgi:hypothetical protein